MKGIVAGCALVAYADGWVTDEERDRMLGLIRAFEPIEAFNIKDVETAFEALTDRFIADQQAGETAALAAVARLKGVDRYPALLVETCCAIADADGGFDEEERNAAVRICKSLGLDAETFGLAEAP
ncbi:MAG TPA: TerB family tellurite resistance protein [Sphingomonadaceae bacterium]|nr:TerB family tellurite resistance protein [Sphingomonadaceae bacterium]